MNKVKFDIIIIIIRGQMIYLKMNSSVKHKEQQKLKSNMLSNTTHAPVCYSTPTIYCFA